MGLVSLVALSLPCPSRRHSDRVLEWDRRQRGILWANAPQSDSWHTTAAGTLYAFDASDITKLLWSSQQNVARDALGNFAKFTPPVVVDGRVIMATFSNAIRVYRLLK